DCVIPSVNQQHLPVLTPPPCREGAGGWVKYPSLGVPPMPRALLLLPAFLLLIAFALPGSSAEADQDAIRKAVTFYASFDDEVKGDFGGGQLTFDTRSNHPTEKGKYVIDKGVSDKAFRIAKDKGISGGALEAVDVLPNNGRIFIPAKGNLAYKADGWSGS